MDKSVEGSGITCLVFVPRGRFNLLLRPKTFCPNRLTHDGLDTTVLVVSSFWNEVVRACLCIYSSVPNTRLPFRTVVHSSLSNIARSLLMNERDAMAVNCIVNKYQHVVQKNRWPQNWCFPLTGAYSVPSVKGFIPSLTYDTKIDANVIHTAVGDVLPTCTCLHCAHHLSPRRIHRSIVVDMHHPGVIFKQ